MGEIPGQILLLHVGIPDEFIQWTRIIYSGARSVIRHKNWMTATFDMERGVHQGCPLSCHLFNLVGQVLVYSLHQAGFFAWWGKPGDPCSLYADENIVNIVANIQQLPELVAHIQWVGQFMGLNLNLDKTIAFYYKQIGTLTVAGVMVRNAPVKYLGAYLGQGDLSQMNFGKPLKAACLKINHIIRDI